MYKAQHDHRIHLQGKISGLIYDMLRNRLSQIRQTSRVILNILSDELFEFQFHTRYGRRKQRDRKLLVSLYPCPFLHFHSI
jgi:hypothetical protein